MNGKYETSKGKYNKIILKDEKRKIDYKKEETKRRAKQNNKNL